jgi:hypothetical protein
LKINQLQLAGLWIFECYGLMFKIDSALKVPGYRRICTQASAKVVQTCVKNMVREIFFCQMNSTIATFLDCRNWKCSVNVYLIRRLVCGCDRKTFKKDLLDKIGGYRFIQRDEFEALNESFKDESPLEKLVSGQKKMLCDGAANKNNYPINESWVQKNMERALFYQLFTLIYQYFNQVSQQPDAESKRAIVPTSSDACQNIVINNEILYYIGAHARYFKNKSLGKLQALAEDL